MNQMIQGNVSQAGNHTPGLEVTRIGRTDLLEAIKANRQRHQTAFDQAVPVFKAELEEKLKDTAKKIKELLQQSSTLQSPESLKGFGRQLAQLNEVVHINFPEQHLDEYDKTIRKLEMSIDNVLDLTDAEFNRYVMDDWSWKQNFLKNTIAYSAKAKF